MRQIIHTTPWVNNPNSNGGGGGGTSTSRFSNSSRSNNQQQRGDNNKMGLLSVANQRHAATDNKHLSSSSLRTNNNNPNNESMDSSFEVLNNGAIHNQSAAQETSWDAVFNNDSSEIVGTSTRTTISNNNGSNNKYTPTSSTVGGRYNPKSISRSAVVTPSPSAKSKTMGRQRERNYLNRTQQQHQQPEEMTYVSASAVSSTADNNSRTTTGGSRISRLASLFSSRAVVASESSASAPSPAPPTSSSPTTNPPPSPSRSESSSGYVGWPGTQDKQGATVVAESSYEESDIISGGDKVKGGYQQEVQNNVDRELTKWMVNSDEYNSSEKSDSPIKHSRIEEYDKIHRLAAEGNQQYPSSSSPSSPSSPLQSNAYNIDNSGGINFIQAHDGGRGNEIANTNIIAEPQWDHPDHDHHDNMSDLSTSYSKTSSAYFDPREVQAIQKGHTKQLFGINQNKLGAATVMRRCQSSSSGQAKRPHTRQTHHKQALQSLTEETLAMKDHFSPPPRNYSNNAATVGFRGLLDRTQDVPNLMDDNASDSTSAVSAATSQHYDNDYDYAKTNQYTSSSSAPPSPSSTYYKHKRGILRQKQHVTTIEENSTTTDDNNSYSFTRDQVDVGSDIFDGISKASLDYQSIDEKDGGEVGILGATSRASMEKINIALLGGGLTTIQTTTDDFTNRKTASDFDETLTNSDYDQYGFAKIPAFHEMVSAGLSHHDRSLSSQSLLFATLPSQKQSLERQNISDHHPANTPAHNEVEDFDFDEYYIHPEEMQILVKKFRKISRSRYPRLDYKDLEKEEDSTKAFALSEMRSRIMEKDIERGLERRGGTTVVDDIVMTSYNKAALRVRDAVIVAKAWRDGATPQDVINTANLTRRSERCYYIPRLESNARGVSKYTWEEVNWVDDNELSQYRCHSIGPRHLKGVEMFTIGDCQSILLKLCNERCQELRDELNDATADQIEAEGLMKEEGETETFDDMMTEAEMTYLSSMEAVKSLSQKLVLAEKAFTLVRSRIEKLVAKYESLLVHFENETESLAPSSVFSYESSCYSETYSFAAAAKQREEETLARKAQRAELRAEVVTRESLLARQEVKATRKEKENELNNLKARLADLQSESSVAFTEKSHSVVLARNITRTNQANRRSSGSGEGGAGGRDNSRLKIEDIKQRFRNRSAAKFQFASSKRSDDDTPKQTSAYSNNDNGNSFHRTVGEEMFQHLDFYERSLKAVKESNQR